MPTDPQAITNADGTYTIAGIAPGTIRIFDVVPAGWHATSPVSSVRSLVLKNGENITGINYGNAEPRNSTISGLVFADTNKNGVRDPLEHGLAGITVYLDLNNNGALDPTDPQTVTSENLYYTPTAQRSRIVQLCAPCFRNLFCPSGNSGGTEFHTVYAV